MNWKKLMLGDLEHTFTSRDGKEKQALNLKVAYYQRCWY